MLFDPEIPPDPADGAEFEAAWEESLLGVAELPGPDSVGRVVEIADMMSVFAARRAVWIDALRLEALADAERYGHGLRQVTERSVRLELAAALRVTEHAAAGLMAQAEALVHRYPAALDSLAQARMTERHAEILVDGVDAVEPEFRERILSRGIELAESQPVGVFRRSLRALIDNVRSATLAERHEAALVERRVAIESADDAMGWLHAFAPLVELRAIHGRLTAEAKVLAAQDGEMRSLDQLRADVFGDLLIDGETDALPPEARGIRATVVVTVPVLALLDQDGQSGGATVEGVGPIPMARARELCAGSDGWMRVLTHPETGMVLSVGRERYRPPPSLRRLVRWRADRCMAPGCGIPAARCEVDHTLAWEHGGSTSLDNLAPVCKGHHTVKHHGGWRVRQIDDSGGALEWTSPAGRRYRVEPERRVPVFQPAAADDQPPF